MLKLPQLPDRVPVRIVIHVSPEQNRALTAYAAAYRQAYGREESVADLIPFMLDAFLAGDREFAKARKEAPPVSTEPKPARRGRRKKTEAPPAPIPNPEEASS